MPSPLLAQSFLYAILLLANNLAYGQVARFQSADMSDVLSIENQYAANVALVRKNANLAQQEECFAFPGRRCYQRLADSIIMAYVPPFRPAFSKTYDANFVDGYIFGRFETDGIVFVPDSSVLNGEKLWEFYVDAYERKLLIHQGVSPPTNFKYYAIRRSFSRSKASIDEMYAVCEVYVIELPDLVKTGACAPVAVLSNRKRWIAAEMFATPSGGGIDPDLSVLIEFQDREPGQALNQALKRQLEGPPWNLITKFRGTSLVAGSDRRPSSIVRGYREDSNVRVEFTKLNPRTMLLEIDYYFYVNQLATTRSLDWHQPSREMHDMYMAALRETVRRAVGEICSSVTWKDSESAVCR